MDAGSADDQQALKRLLNSRFSCRAFLPTPVPEDTIHQILEIAGRSASNNNAQPWQVVVTTGAGTERFREAFHEAAQTETWAPDYPTAMHEDIYKERSRACGLALYQSVGIGRGEPERSRAQLLENFRLFGAPHAAIISSDIRQGAFGALDCGAYISNFVLAARSLGVDSIAQAAFAQLAPFLRRYFGLDEKRVIVSGISFGYADPAHPVNQFRTARAPLEEIVSFIRD